VDKYGPGGNGSGISIIDYKNGVIKQLATANGFSKNYATSLLEDNNGQMWTGGIGEVSIINPNEKLVKKLSNAPELKKANVFTLRKDSKDQLWIGSNGDGIYVTDPAGKTIKYLSTAQGLISNDVTTLMEDTAGNMWIGTQKGIDVADLKNNTLTSFTTKEGLAADGSWTLNERDGNIYVGTTNGLTILTRTAKENKQQLWKAASYGKEQGLTSLDFAENSSLLTKKGQLWAGVNEQILTIINEIKADTLTTPAYITGINILDKPQFFSNRSVTEKLLTAIDTLWKTEKDSFYANKQLPVDSGYLQKNKITWDSVQGPYLMPVNLQLPYSQNYLSFNFSGTHISNPDKAMYRYILEGIDKTWSPIIEKSFSENYRDLPPGSYTFKVSSKGMNNLWSEPAAFSFTILPPWWQTWWAYSLYVLIMISCIALFIRIRSQKLRSENRILEEKVARRTAQLNESLEGLKATQKQLIQSEKMASLGELTAGIAHEIQNPLNFVNNFSDVNIELLSELKEGPLQKLPETDKKDAKKF
jgi:streptogramin lyase